MKLWSRVVQFGFRLLYHEMSFTYDIVSRFVSLGDWGTWQQAIFNFLPKPSETGLLLELAHGTGHIQVELAHRGYKSIALDFSAQMGHIAQKRLYQQKLSPHLIRASGMALPFGDSQFQYAICTFPTEFIFNPKTLSELHRVMKPQGEIIIVLHGELMRENIQTHIVDVAYAVANHRPPSNLEKRVNDRVTPYGFSPTWHRVMHEKSCSSVIILKRG